MKNRTVVLEARKRTRHAGFTLVELIVAVGLFAFIMTLASGAYLLMIGLNRQVQGVATGIDNLAFALDEMTRTIRTGTHYACGGSGDCPNGGTTFSLTDVEGASVSYRASDGVLIKTKNGVDSPLSDPTITISSLAFYANGTSATSAGDYAQPRVTIVISGTVSSGPGKTEPFTVQTGATMRGTDISS